MGDPDPLPRPGAGSDNPLLAPPDRPEMRGPARKQPVRFAVNRDWVIPVECTADGVALLSAGQKFSLAELQTEPAGRNPLLLAVRGMIERRQATVRTGEAPYRPQLRFLVLPDGYRAYYLAYPALETLGLTMTRELREATKEKP